MIAATVEMMVIFFRIGESSRQSNEMWGNATVSLQSESAVKSMFGGLWRWLVDGGGRFRGHAWTVARCRLQATGDGIQ